MVYPSHESDSPPGILSRKMVEFVTAMNEGWIGLSTLNNEMPDLRKPYEIYEDDLDKIWDGTLKSKSERLGGGHL